MPISDIEFLDSLTGFAVTGSKTVFDTNYILKTTNGGDNWFVSYKDYNNYFKVIFLDNYIGYVCGSSFQINGIIYKTTNAGDNWFTLNTPFGMNYDDMSVLNEDTIWVADDNSLNGGIYRTTNGGQNWTQQYFNPSNNPDKIYMYNSNIGFFSTGFQLFKTTNSGFNWSVIPSEGGFSYMYFKDSLNGWKAAGDIKKTTNGGLNWQAQTLPVGGIIQVSSLIEFFQVNNDTLWGVGGTVRYGPGNERGLIYKTSNGGENWGYQIPDTVIHLWKYYNIDFSNKLNGWSFVPNSNVHTVTGGNDTTYYTGINHASNKIPTGFKLYQNYPNPFNPTTNIRFEIPKTSFVKLIVYDILGKEVATLVNEKLSSGTFEVDWPAPTGNATGYTSGVYFYRIETKDFSETKKMLLIK